MAVTDQFGSASIDVKRPGRLCVPVDKNGEGILDAATHLTCYDVRAKRPSARRTLYVENQLGVDELSVEVGQGPVGLCVPSEKLCRDPMRLSRRVDEF